ncbi:MAG: DUF3943 domain-containing protein [bacterium]
MKNKVIASVLAFSTLFTNLMTPVFAGEFELKNNKNKVELIEPISNKSLAGGVSVNTSISKEIKFNLTAEQKAAAYKVFRHKEGNKEYILLVPQLPSLSYNDKPIVVEYNSAKRFHDCITLLMLGGLSVTHSQEEAFGDRTADNIFFGNIKNPAKGLIDGWKADDNAFWINYIGHPGEFFLLANYLKTTGASDKETLLFAEMTNFLWEYVCEGVYVAPSPKDLIDDTLGALAGIYFYNKVGNRFFPQGVSKLRKFGYNQKIEFHPSVKYNRRTNGVAIGARITKKI